MKQDEYAKGEKPEVEMLPPREGVEGVKQDEYAKEVNEVLQRLKQDISCTEKRKLRRKLEKLSQLGKKAAASGWRKE